MPRECWNVGLIPARSVLKFAPTDWDKPSEVRADAR
jgi:hypothetical protein